MSFSLQLSDVFGGSVSDVSALHCPYCEGTKIEIISVQQKDLDVQLKVICLGCKALDRSLLISCSNGQTRLCWTT